MKFCITLLVVAVIAVAGVTGLSSEFLDSECPKVCTRMWRPICAKLNGFPISISNKCLFDGLLQCARADNRVWEFQYEGPCQSDDATNEEEDYLVGITSDEDADESEVNENEIGEVDPQDFSYEYEIDAE